MLDLCSVVPDRKAMVFGVFSMDTIQALAQVTRSVTSSCTFDAPAVGTFFLRHVLHQPLPHRLQTALHQFRWMWPGCICIWMLGDLVLEHLWNCGEDAKLSESSQQRETKDAWLCNSFVMCVFSSLLFPKLYKMLIIVYAVAVGPYVSLWLANVSSWLVYGPPSTITIKYHFYAFLKLGAKKSSPEKIRSRI